MPVKDGLVEKELRPHKGIIATLRDPASLSPSQANELAESEHDSIVNSLAKYSKKLDDWVNHLALTL